MPNTLGLKKQRRLAVNFRNPEAYVFQKTSACGVPNTGLGSAEKCSLSTTPRKLGHCSKPKLRSGTDVQPAQQPRWCQTTKSGRHEGEANPPLQVLAVGPRLWRNKRQAGGKPGRPSWGKGKAEASTHQLGSLHPNYKGI